MHAITPHLLSLALGTCLSCLAPATAWAKDAAAVNLDAGFAVEGQASKLLSVSDGKALKGLRRVAVPQFNVEFITSDDVSAQTSGFGSAGRSTATGYYKLVGVAEPDFQALAEQVYAGFLRDLKASGLEVVPLADVAITPTWRKLVAGGQTLPLRSDSAVTVAMPGMAIYGLNRASSTSGKKGVFGALSGLSSGFGAVSAVGDNMQLQTELGDAALLEVSMRVHFAQLENNTRGFLGRLGSTASVSAKIHASISNATLAVQNGPMVSMLTLSQPLVLDPAAFSELRKQASTTGDMVGAVAVGLLKLAIGSKDSSSQESYEAVADSARYREVVGSGLGTVGQLFAQRMKADR